MQAEYQFRQTCELCSLLNEVGLSRRELQERTMTGMTLKVVDTPEDSVTSGLDDDVIQSHPDGSGF